MARVLNPLNATEARGRVGGLVYNTWRGARYVKPNTSPAQPRTPRQLQIRAWTTYLVRYWALISADNRGFWNDYATSHPDIDWTKSPKRLTGLNWFVRCNLRLLDLALSIIEAPPAVAAPDAPSDFVATGAAGSIGTTWTAMAGTNLQADLWVAGPFSVGVAAKIERAKHAGYSDGESPPINLSPLQPGRYTCWLRTIDEDTGLASPWVSDTADVS